MLIDIAVIAGLILIGAAIGTKWPYILVRLPFVGKYLV